MDSDQGFDLRSSSEYNWIVEMLSVKLENLHELVNTLVSVRVLKAQEASTLLLGNNAQDLSKDLLSWVTTLLHKPETSLISKAICVEVIIAFLFIGQGHCKLKKIISATQ